MVFITDGQENASKEFTKAQVAKMVKDQEKAGWQFVFLSADLASIGEAHTYGFAANKVMAFDKTSRGSARMFASLSDQVCCFRAPRRSDLTFTESDRKKQNAEKLRKPAAK